MIRASYTPVLALALLACASPSPAGSPPAPGHPAAMSIVMAERAFAGTAARQGITPAFLSVLAEDGILFRPTAVRGKAYLTERPPARGLLTWEPAFAEVSAAGDLGYTTGPWEYRRRRLTEPAESFGHYVSAWRRKAGGRWRLAIDIGVNHAAHPPGAVSVTARAMPSRPDTAANTDTTAARMAMLAAERTLAAALERGDSTAYLAALADDARFYRDGILPVVGRTAIAEVLQRKTPGKRWRTDGSAIARSADLGYTYGTLDVAGADGIYLHIWRRGPDGGWRLALDLAHPVAPAG